MTINLSEHDNYRQVEKALREGRADIGLTVLPAAEDLAIWVMLENEYAALMPPRFQAASQRLTGADLTQQPMIMPPLDRVMMWDVYAHSQAHGHHLNVISEVETDTTIVNLVAQGMGATILPRLAAEPIPSAVQVFSLPEPLSRVIGAAILADGLHTPAIYGCLDVLKAMAKPNPQP